MARAQAKMHTPRSPPVTTDSIHPELLQEIFASDQDMYPAPLTWERLEGWTRASPELALSLWFTGVDDSASRPLVGAVIALPILASCWRDLLVGKVKETDVDPETMFPRESDPGAEIGLHVFHVERYEAPGTQEMVPRIAEISMKAVVEAAREKGWKVVGYSALTATPEGRRCFERMGFNPTGYEEFWVSCESSPEMQLVTVSAETAHERKLLEEQSVKGHATMLAKHVSSADAA
ncbi:hypothetical protein CkaCkLH20_08641 [Colletotrichum karsti]|uniref:Uncharacterized protein n=1 Tax=Colletotrichum karsti TaxID=1095194 RepID=A0A9P6I163_9PEZI|nr:uncharacterized protein CkaCkLH20_08641 [Colletotrichum karsti]KAF9873907.1 hypothetical protein CkaCkLH20_08641 [Colletotrichum karsti]